MGNALVKKIEPAAVRTSPALPMIDISGLRASADRRRETADDIAAACEAAGIFAVSGHGIPTDMSDSAARLAATFFDLPLADKLAVCVREGAGYTPVAYGNRSGNGPGVVRTELKETLNVLKEPARNRWPAAPHGMAPVLSAYLAAAEQVAVDVVQLMSLALRGDPHAFDGELTDSVSFLRIINYPAPVGGMRPGEFRCEEHSDYGTISVLQFGDQPGGLQARAADGSWWDVHLPAGALLVNVGDVMERWSGSRFPATVHRVVNPPATSAADSRRQSLTLFHNPRSIAPKVHAYLGY